MENQDKLCIMLPTRQRPEGFERALKSYLDNTAGVSDIYFVFQNPQEEFLQENLNIARKYGLMDNLWLVGDIGFIPKINFMVDKYNDYGAYMILNDDQIIQTKEFDKILLDKIDEKEKESGHRAWILHWKDGLQDAKLCQSFATREWLDIVGSYYPRGYMRHLYSDNMYHFLGSQCEILNYMPNVNIEHLHFVNKKSKMDSSYQATNSQEAWDRDNQEFGRWLKEHGMETVDKILAVTEKDEKERKRKRGNAEKEIETLFAPPKEITENEVVPA